MYKYKICIEVSTYIILSVSIGTRFCRNAKYGFQASFSDTFILDTFISDTLSVLNVAFPLKPFNLGSCIFPDYFGF